MDWYEDISDNVVLVKERKDKFLILFYQFTPGVQYYYQEKVVYCVVAFSVSYLLSIYSKFIKIHKD